MNSDVKVTATKILHAQSVRMPNFQDVSAAANRYVLEEVMREFDTDLILGAPGWSVVSSPPGLRHLLDRRLKWKDRLTLLRCLWNGHEMVADRIEDRRPRLVVKCVGCKIVVYQKNDG
jgi:hypothetical protein